MQSEIQERKDAAAKLRAQLDADTQTKRERSIQEAKRAKEHRDRVMQEREAARQAEMQRRRYSLI